MYGMGSFQSRLQYLPSVTIWVALEDLYLGEPLGINQGNPMCGSPLKIFGIIHPRTFYLESFRPCRYLVCLEFCMLPLMIKSTSWCSQPLATVWLHAK